MPEWHSVNLQAALSDPPPPLPPARALCLQVPAGWSLPGASSWDKPHYATMPKGFSPCGNKAYKTMKQITQQDGSLISQCL